MSTKAGGADRQSGQGQPWPAGALALLACTLAGTLLNLAGWRDWAPTWPALGSLLLLGLALLAAYRRRVWLAAALVVPVILMSGLIMVVVIAGWRADLAAQAAVLVELPANSAAGLLAAALALVLGLRDGAGTPRQMTGMVLAAVAVALGTFGLLGRVLGITPGIGWGAVSSVSAVTGAGLVICGATLLLRPATGQGRSAAGGALLPALLVLAISLGATAMAWRFSAVAVGLAQQQRFEHQAVQLAESVRLHLLGYVDVLRGAQGLFAASASVEADEWQRYWDQLDLAARYPGIDGMGYAPRVTAAAREDFERQLEALRPGLRIWPVSSQLEYFPVTFLEPATFSNLRQTGFDLASDAQCREALQRALARGEPALTGRVEVRRNGSARGEPGFYVFVPLQPGRRDEDPSVHVDGVAFFSFRARDWMQPIGREFRSELHLRLHDGETPEPQNILFADDGGSGAAAAGFSRILPIEVAGRRWTLSVQAAPEFFSHASPTPRWVLLVGMACSLMLFAIAWLLAGARARAERIAGEMTAELRRSQRAFQALTDTATDAIIAAGADGRIRYVNPATARCFGYDTAALLEQDIAMLMPPRYRDAHHAGLARFLAGGGARVIGSTVEMAGLRSDGTEFPLEISIAHWQADGEAHFTAIVRDISRRRDTERAMEAQRRELERSNADLEQFAYVASHDLQEPLRMVASYVQLLARRYKGKLDQDADDFIGFAVDGAMRMQRLIDDLLTYSRIATRAEPARAVAAGECAAAALRNLAARVRETGAQVVVGELPVVQMDPLQLTQLFQNLVGNALKFCGQNTPHVELDAQREDDSWHFRVRDNGIGLDPQYAERIFVIFQRLHTRQAYAGTGIGLAICKKIVERAGGRIWVESTVGQGATFHFTLPVVEKTA